MLFLFLAASIPMMEAKLLASRPEDQTVLDTVPRLVPFTKL